MPVLAAFRSSVLFAFLCSVKKLEKLAQQYDVAIILVAHPKKSSAAFDNDTVSTGSGNISHSGIGGGKYINANDFLVIKSQKINEIYAKEFAQMYDGKFHKEKQAIQNKKNIVLEDESKISVYFAPIDNYFLDEDKYLKIDYDKMFNNLNVFIIMCFICYLLS